jgi:hypothetical protein
VTRWLVVKAVLGGLGLLLGASAMLLDYRPLGWVAVGILVAAFLVRFVERRD